LIRSSVARRSMSLTVEEIKVSEPTSMSSETPAKVMTRSLTST